MYRKCSKCPYHFSIKSISLHQYYIHDIPKPISVREQVKKNREKNQELSNPEKSTQHAKKHNHHHHHHHKEENRTTTSKQKTNRNKNRTIHRKSTQSTEDESQHNEEEEEEEDDDDCVVVAKSSKTRKENSSENRHKSRHYAKESPNKHTDRIEKKTTKRTTSQHSRPRAIKHTINIDKESDILYQIPTFKKAYDRLASKSMGDRSFTNAALSMKDEVYKLRLELENINRWVDLKSIGIDSYEESNDSDTGSDSDSHDYRKRSNVTDDTKKKRKRRNDTNSHITPRKHKSIATARSDTTALKESITSHRSAKTIRSDSLVRRRASDDFSSDSDPILPYSPTFETDFPNTLSNGIFDRSTLDDMMSTCESCYEQISFGDDTHKCLGNSHDYITDRVVDFNKY